MTRLHTFMVMALTVLAIGACTNAPPAGRAAINSFAHIQPLPLDVANIEVFDDFQPSLEAPYIEHTMVNPPYRAAYNMTQRAFTADGIERALQVRMTEASVKHSERVVKQNNFIKTREHVYQAHLKADVIMTHNDSVRQELGRGAIDVQRNMTVPASMSLTEREIALNGMIEKLVMDYHDGLVDILRDDFQVLRP